MTTRALSTSVAEWLRRRSSTVRTTRRLAAGYVAVATALATATVAAPSAAAAEGACGGLNAIACENLLPGTPASVWDTVGVGSETIQGFATDMSVNIGATASFKIKTDATSYSIEIYRLGWYQGNGARLVATIQPNVPLPQEQPACLTDAETNLVDCGTWGVSASWAVPTTAVSGVYLARLVRADNGQDSHIPFVVRNDASHSRLVFQTSDTTWQAYNDYGGTSLYGGPNGRGTKVSYNRPFSTRGGIAARDYLFANEFPMLRFLERNGYDVSYISGVDTDRHGGLLTNHGVFLSVGHDEYWSGTQRANVEAARDAGLHLAFFSGNEVYWKTRWETSIDGSGQSHRTLVCYKETKDNAKTDPSVEWTGTWRDPRFSPPSDGGRPENGLTGTAYMSNFTDLAIQVSAEEGRLRLWRNTAAATQTPGSTMSLAPHTVGYESDEDLDNGFRPAGLIRLSTTSGGVPEYLQDYGSTTAPGTTTHHLTLHRVASGALVFGAGTVQWAWGLDATHDGDGAPADPVMQQATVNLFADMGALATTLQPGLVSATASTDSSPPAVTVTAPAAGAAIGNGAAVTVTGTASDAAGEVAGVEVSTDGGIRWHPAQGTTSWSYTYVQHGSGPVAILVRATDDSLNTSAPVSHGVLVSCPCSLFGSEVPAIVDSGDPNPVELGVRVRFEATGWVTALRFHKAIQNTGSHVGSLWTTTGALLARGQFTDESPSGWQTLMLAAPVAVAAGATLVASYSAPSGHYSVTAGQFVTDYASAPLTAPAATTEAGNGVYGTVGSFPTSRYGAPSYGVDVLFSDIDTFAPVLSTTTPVDGASSVAVDAALNATFSEDVQVPSVTMTVTDGAGAGIAGTAAYEPATRTVTFTPAGPLARETRLIVTVSATDLAGNAMAPATFAFTTAAPDQQAGVCPCSIWNDDDAPTIRAYPDSSANELGMTFIPEIDGIVTGVRFFKGAGNAGPHTGSLWTESGSLLATATFAEESAEGWQSVTFSAPVSVVAGTRYVVSYYAPAGRYAVNINDFAQAGITVSPLSVPRGGGSFRAGSAGFPANASSSNYWVQPVFTVPAGVKPVVTAIVPTSDSTNVRTEAVFSATFGSLVQPGSAVIEVRGPGGASVAGVLSWDSPKRTARFAPTSPLADGTSYELAVSGARSLGGTAMDPVSATFTTAGITACPCTTMSSSAHPAVIDSGDSGAITLGLRFVPTADGQITGVRFFKSPGNTGTHVGSLWSAGGERLATGTFTGETASGWQTLTFSQAVDVDAGQTYVASYYAPSGHYAVDLDAVATGWTNGPLTVPGGSNGVYRYGADLFPTASYRSANYFVDPVFQTGSPPDTTPASVIASTPLGGASSVAVTVAPTARFSEPIDVGTLSMGLTGPDGAPVPGTTTYDPQSRTAQFTPASALTRGATYAVSASATDVPGNAMSPATWSFTTMLPSPTAGVCPCAVWDDTAVPGTIDDPDRARIEVGAAFSVDSPQQAVGIRFYKGTVNPGPHVASLWSETGVLLAQAATTTESSTGWQSVAFLTPVPLTPGTTYVVSYLAPTGGYSSTIAGLAAPVDVTPIHIPAGGGRYVYGGGFPSALSQANYWVTPVVDAAPVISGVQAQVAPGAMTVTWTTDEPASSVLTYGTTSALGQILVGTGAPTTSHSLTVTGLGSATTYFYSVSSGDASGLATVAPDPPETVTTPDTVAPVVSAVTATPGANQVTVTWTTDEPSTSVVGYGSTPALGSSAVGADGTSHSVTITGLGSATTYSYAVTSVDAAGNSTTGAVATFTTPDTVAPVVSAVTATPGSTTAPSTTATVAWVTDEPATARVDYGTSAGALTLTATGPVGTAHAVALTGLTPSTRYYYRVTSVDVAGNSTTTPASAAAAAVYAPPVFPKVVDSTAELALGTRSNTVVTTYGAGMVTLRAAYLNELNGTTLGAGLTSSVLSTGGTTVVSGGSATLTGTRVLNSTAFTTGGSVTWTGDLRTSDQRVGVMATNGMTDLAYFTRDAAGQLVATANDGIFYNTSIVITPAVAPGPHEYRVDYTTSSASFFVDGVQVATRTYIPTDALYSFAQDSDRTNGGLAIDWVRVGAYAASGTYTSSVFDAGAPVAWDSASREAVVPAGTTLIMRVRSGNTATPGTGWTTWLTVPASGAIARTGRYVQFQLSLTLTGTRFASPTVSKVTLNYHLL